MPVNDRPAIGKKSAYIIELSLFENRTQYLGFQATYLVDNIIRKKGNYNVLKRENERFLKEKNMKLESGDYFRTIECAINQANIIVGVAVTSHQGRTIKAGVFDGFKKDIEIKSSEYPCCLYGSYSMEGF